MELSQKMIPFPTASDEDDGAGLGDSGDVDDERDHGIDGDGDEADYGILQLSRMLLPP